MFSRTGHGDKQQVAPLLILKKLNPADLKHNCSMIKVLREKSVCFTAERKKGVVHRIEKRKKTTRIPGLHPYWIYIRDGSVKFAILNREAGKPTFYPLIHWIRVLIFSAPNSRRRLKLRAAHSHHRENISVRSAGIRTYAQRWFVNISSHLQSLFLALCLCWRQSWFRRKRTTSSTPRYVHCSTF